MRIAGIQFPICWEDPEENIRRVEPLLQQAAESGAKLAALPEMFGTGFSMNVPLVLNQASFIESQTTLLASRCQISILAGIAQREPNPQSGTPGNMAVLFDSKGKRLLHYQKIHPFSYGEEQHHFSGGKKINTFSIEGLRVTPFICYDLRFPEIFRAAAADTDLFIVIANWPANRRQAWQILLKARAIENQCFVLGVNRTGYGNQIEYSGGSMLINPLGEVIMEAYDDFAIVTGDVDATQVQEFRRQFPALRDRRQELYRIFNP
jgi:omega-amidase